MYETEISIKVRAKNMVQCCPIKGKRSQPKRSPERFSGLRVEAGESCNETHVKTKRINSEPVLKSILHTENREPASFPDNLMLM